MQSTLQTSIQPRFRTIDGVSVRYAEGGDPGAGTHALLLSPWPESVFAFEATWPALAEHAHLVAVDMPGFGQSEHRDELMAPRAMGDFVARIVDAFGLERPHAVGPDVGTGASLYAEALHPGLFRTLVVGSAGTAYPLQLSGVLKEWVEAPSVEPYRQIGGKAIVDVALGTLERYTPSAAARDDYRASYAGDRFARSLAYVRAYPEDLRVLGGLLPQIRTPVRVIAGQRDAVVPLANAEYLRDRIPGCDLAVLDAGHFTWEDAAGAYAELVVDWWKKGAH